MTPAAATSKHHARTLRPAPSHVPLRSAPFAARAALAGLVVLTAGCGDRSHLVGETGATGGAGPGGATGGVLGTGGGPGPDSGGGAGGVGVVVGPVGASPETTPFPQICGADGWCWVNPLPQGTYLSSVWGSSRDDIWLGGDSGVIHWDGRTWTYSSPVGSVENISGSAPDDVWIVAKDLWHFDGKAWTVVPFDVRPSAIAVIARNDVWAVGPFGVRHFDGLQWSDSPTPMPVARVSRSNGWLVA